MAQTSTQAIGATTIRENVELQIYQNSESRSVVEKIEYKIKIVNTYYTNKNLEKPKFLEAAKKLYECNDEWHILESKREWQNSDLFYESISLTSALHVTLMNMPESFAIKLAIRQSNKEYIFAISSAGVAEITNF